MKKFVVGVLAGIGVLTILGFFGFIGLTMLAASAKPSVANNTFLDLSISGEYIESKPGDLWADFSLDDVDLFRDLTDGIIRARDDDRIEGLFIKMGSSNLGIAQSQELRSAIQSFRETGKWAIVHFETAGEWRSAILPYYIATASDSIYLSPPGDINILGVSLSTPFIRGTLDKLDIYPDMDHIGDYKTAMNTVTHKKYTVAHKEMMTNILDSIYDQLCEGIAEGRGMELDKVKEIMNNGPYISEEALSANLVDELLYLDEVRDRLKAKTDKDKGISLKTYLKAAGRPHSKGKNRVALIHGTGNVVRGKSFYAPMSGTMVMGSTTLSKAFRKAADNDRIKAIIFRVDCPGGSYIASDVIWREVARAREKKPVIVTMSDVAGSGGYFVALPASRILAQPGTITASIGVVGGKWNMKGFYDKIGFSFDSVKRGNNSTLYSELQNYTTSERERFENFLDRIYQDFTNKVADAREMEWADVNEIGRGRVWMGREALELGLIDQLGGMEEAIVAAKELADIPDDEGIRLETYPKKPSRMELILEEFGQTESEYQSSLSVLRQDLRLMQQQIGMIESAFQGSGVLSMPPLMIEGSEIHP